MSEPIVFIVFIPDGAELQSPDLMNMGVYALFKGTESYSVEGGTEFRFNQGGIEKISTEQLYALIQFGALGVSCTGKIGPRWMEMSNAEYIGLVPEVFPESTKPGTEEGTTQQMTFSEYVPFATQSQDGTSWLVQLSEVAAGETCGDGLSWDEYLIWFNTYGTRVLSATAGQALLESAKYTTETPE